MSAPGFWEIVALAVLALLIFGPEKLPGMARSIGRTLGNVKREAQTTMDELKRAADLEELRSARRELSKVTAEIEREANLTDSVDDARSKGRRPEASAAAPPPFDPDAT